MEFLIQIATTGGLIALVLLAAQRLGHRTAGVLAGLPFTTVPALGWIAADRGVELACRTAVGSVFGCILVPVFAIAYDRAARRWSPAPSLLAGLAAVGCAMAFAGWMPLALWPAIGLCTVGSVLALRLLREPDGTSRPRRHAPARMSSIAISAGLVGVVTAIVASLASGAGPLVAGLVAGIPTLGLAAVVNQHRAQGPASVTPFLRGYVVSTAGKAGLLLCVLIALGAAAAPEPAQVTQDAAANRS